MRHQSFEDQLKSQQKRIDHLEQERETLYQRHKREREQLESELEDKRSVIKRYEAEFKEVSS